MKQDVIQINNQIRRLTKDETVPVMEMDCRRKKKEEGKKQHVYPEAREEVILS